MAVTLIGLGGGQLRCTFEFNYKNLGWSETWWLAATSIASIIDKLKSYVETRLAFQPRDVEFVAVRVSEEGQSRKSRLFAAGRNDGDDTYPSFYLGTIGTFGIGGDTKWDIGQQAVQTEVIVQGIRVGWRYVAILPDLVSTTNPGTISFGAVPSWRDAWIAWKVKLIADAWQIRVSQASSARPEKKIGSWRRSLTTGADWQIVLRPQNAAEGIGLDKYVVVRGARMKYSGLRSPNGRWQVSDIVADNAEGEVALTLAGTGGLSLQHLSSQGAVYQSGTDYLTPSQLSPWAVTKHKRGGPFPRERGRRSKPRFPPS